MFLPYPWTEIRTGNAPPPAWRPKVVRGAIQSVAVNPFRANSCLFTSALILVGLAIVAHTAEVKHRELLEIATGLPELLTSSRAHNKTKRYECYFSKWKEWSSRFPEVRTLPAEPIYVALFITSLIQGGKSFQVIKSVFYAIAWFHRLGDRKNPCDSQMCRNLLEAAKRSFNSKVAKKEPIQVEHIRKIYKLVGGTNADTLQLRTLSMILLGFAAFLRYEEISRLRAWDILCYKMYGKIFIERSKTDIYREGSYVHLARLTSRLCPLTILNVYMMRVGVTGTDQLIFRALTYHKSTRTHVLRRHDTCIQHRQGPVFIDGGNRPRPELFWFTQLTSRGRDYFANNCTRDRLFKRHGRWRSERGQDGYIRDDLDILLSVSLNLGL